MRINRIKRLAAVGGLAGLVIFSLFTAISQPGTHPRRSGTLLASQAFASEKPAGAAAPAATARAAGTPRASAPEPAATRPAADDTSATRIIFRPDPLATLADSLKQKERDLDEREKALKKKEEYLEAIRKETATNLASIKDLYNKLEMKSAQAKQQREKDLAKWRSIYQSMPPEKAGPIIQGLETDLALELLSQMDPKKAAKILSTIQSQKAVELTKKLGEKKL